jgi:shikimate dehydrogenase
MPPLYGLIGYPLSHSFSPAYFKKKFAELRIDATYKPFPLSAINELIPLLRAHADIAGLNVTIPYKEAIMPFLDETDEVAKAIGAVNCITIKHNKLKGYNTDAIGFEQSLEPLLQPAHTHALVLGTGGSSRAVVYVLARLGIPHLSVSRYLAAGDLTYEELTPDIIARHKLIINTTPLGMYPHPDEWPSLPYHAIGKDHLLYDLIYNPEETRFLSQGKEYGAAIKNGFEMLKLQADASWEIWDNG